MSKYELTHLSNEQLLAGFAEFRAQERRTMAALLAHIAEIDARHLYLRAGFESMRAYCVHELRLSEDAAAKRIQMARLARELPEIFAAIADGRLSLFAVRLLAPRLTRLNVQELITEAANQTAPEIERLLARWFPQAESLRLDDGVAPQVVAPQWSIPVEHAVRHVQFETVAPRVRTGIAPLSPERYTLQVTLPASTHDKLRHAQALLGHAVPTGDVAEVLDRAFDTLIAKLEQRKFGSASSQGPPRTAATGRSIRAHVRRAVYERDAGQCAYVFADGRRCSSQERLEFDHVKPVARGGLSTVDNLRLVCRAHNQAAAEEVFRQEFVESWRTFRRDGERVQ